MALPAPADNDAAAGALVADIERVYPRVVACSEWVRTYPFLECAFEIAEKARRDCTVVRLPGAQNNIIAAKTVQIDAQGTSVAQRHAKMLTLANPELVAAGGLDTADAMKAIKKMTGFLRSGKWEGALVNAADTLLKGIAKMAVTELLLPGSSGICEVSLVALQSYLQETAVEHGVKLAYKKGDPVAKLAGYNEIEHEWYRRDHATTGADGEILEADSVKKSLDAAARPEKDEATGQMRYNSKLDGPFGYELVENELWDRWVGRGDEAAQESARKKYGARATTQRRRSERAERREGERVRACV